MLTRKAKSLLSFQPCCIAKTRQFPFKPISWFLLSGEITSIVLKSKF
ncbi:hypothetical protein BAZSYMB_SCAFFOLD00080_1 [Bathymodiolus azoricus thioautotrophic gill symbiont]|uniref:Uncharacterized protein n=1 Tax=Bathymodiolus azoricus thioautotrophic gill symbiont TaxID=235205 RepID=A0A1H6L579_9GAMM|nr:hypothetical protein BAZSYMB_SCAFFOLD00080_1 [Bathymodiolus azoricus thioautotrophic gill symbiont]